MTKNNNKIVLSSQDVELRSKLLPLLASFSFAARTYSQLTKNTMENQIKGRLHLDYYVLRRVKERPLMKVPKKARIPRCLISGQLDLGPPSYYPSDLPGRSPGFQRIRCLPPNYPFITIFLQNWRRDFFAQSTCCQAMNFHPTGNLARAAGIFLGKAHQFFQQRKTPRRLIVKGPSSTPTSLRTSEKNPSLQSWDPIKADW